MTLSRMRSSTARFADQPGLDRSSVTVLHKTVSSCTIRHHMRKTASSHDLPPLLLDGVDPLSARVLQALRKTIHVHKQLMAKTLAERGTHPGEAVCLRMLAQHDGMSQRDLADTLHLSRPRVTTMLQGPREGRNRQPATG